MTHNLLRLLLTIVFNTQLSDELKMDAWACLDEYHPEGAARLRTSMVKDKEPCIHEAVNLLLQPLGGIPLEHKEMLH